MAYKRYLVKRTFYIGEIRREVCADSIVEFDGVNLKIGETTYKAPKFEGAIRANWVSLTDNDASEVLRAPVSPENLQRRMPVEVVDSTMGAVLHKKMDLSQTASFTQKEAMDREFGSASEKRAFNADETAKVYMPKTDKEGEKESKKEMATIEPVQKKKRGRPAKVKTASEQVATAGCAEFDTAEDLAKMNPGNFEVTKTGKSKKDIKAPTDKVKSILDRVVVKDDMSAAELKILEEWDSLKHWSKKKVLVKAISSLLVLKYLFDREGPSVKKHISKRMGELQA